MIVAEPVHVPALAVSVWPWLAVPEISGNAVFAGAPEPLVPVIVFVAFESALVEPWLFVAVTRERSL